MKHLLILREQLAPFDVEFAAVERRLDFKSTRGACVTPLVLFPLSFLSRIRKGRTR